MRINHLFVSNFLGATAIDVRTPEPVQLFAGRNGAGKSSLRDAIALALTADLGRVSLKKEAGQLVHAGADAAVCEVEDADGDRFSVSITAAGKITDSQKGRENAPALQYVLDAQRFARLDATERRAFLFGLTGVKMTPAEIDKRLRARGCDEKKVARVLPLLRSGFDAASKEAKSKATEAKGAWRAITGETFGSEKAKTWRATVPPYDAAAAKEAATALQHADVAIEQWQQQIGTLTAQEAHRKALQAKLPPLREQAGMVERIAAKLATDEQQLAEWEADLTKTTAAAGAGPRVGLVHEFAEQMAAVLMHAERCNWIADRGDQQVVAECQALLNRYELEHGKIGAAGGDEKARNRLASVRKSRDLSANAVANDKRDLDAAKRAGAEADAIDAELKDPFDAAALAAAREQVEKLKAERAALVAKADTFKTAKAQAEAAEKKTSDAAAHAADVSAWDVIGDALAPDGIPGEILAEALGPINARLAQAAADTAWMPVVIGADMGLTADGRDYRLLSESEKWRVDAMVAEAVAHLSGTRLLVLDRFDVLDAHGRAELLAWLDVLADTGEIDSAFLFATLKAAPTNLPATIAAHWIENGVVGQLKEAA
jgi:energy-coupling factor transporter ATP-binding protein EcfA2